MRTLQSLKTNSENGYKDMNDWLGARFLKEMESIDCLSEVLRHAIEHGQRLREELVIHQDEFLVNEVRDVIHSSLFLTFIYNLNDRDNLTHCDCVCKELALTSRAIMLACLI